MTLLLCIWNNIHFVLAILSDSLFISSHSLILKSSSFIKQFGSMFGANCLINEELFKINEWLEINKLSLNIAKTKCMLFHMHNKRVIALTPKIINIMTPFTIQDLGDAISLFKDGKAPGLDNIHHEMIKCFGPTTRLWLLDMFNDCLKQQQIPNVWRKAKVVAPLKPGKDPENPKSYRPIARITSFSRG